MAKKKSRQANTGGQSQARQPISSGETLRNTQKKSEHKVEDGFVARYKNIIIPAAIAVITWLFLSTCLNNELTNWDDPGYVRDNYLIKDVSADGINNIFSLSNAVMGNYHPLTILSYAIEYSYRGLQPMIYHRDSLLLHILVTLLVYWFVLLLSRRPVAAAVSALLFGLHPMHVESVAWVAGRKDVLYGSFYMASCIAYLYYLRTTSSRKWLFYAVGFLLFACALLSKPVAVVLPVTLLLVDYFEKRKLDYGMFLEKIPHFAASIACGYKSLIDQKAFGSLNTLDVKYSFVERLALGSYALVTYLWKAVLPAHLCCFYPYPPKVDGTLPVSYYLYTLGVVVLIAGWWMLRKNRIWVFGSLFFIVNIALLLQFIPVGGATLADRYSYIAYLGLFFIAGWFVSGYFEPGAKKNLRYLVAGGAVAYCLVLGYISNERCKVWYDAMTLWTDEIEKEPQNAPNAYNNLGFNYFNKFNESLNQSERKI